MNYRHNENKDMVIKNQKKDLNTSVRKIHDLSEYFISTKESKNNNSLLKSHKNQKFKTIIKTTGKKTSKFKKIDA
jgi:hypothetical protein